MFKFNNDNIFTSYIKQVLASFNLPKYRVYTKEQADYHKNFMENKRSRNKKIACYTDALAVLTNSRAELISKVAELEVEKENTSEEDVTKIAELEAEIERLGDLQVSLAADFTALETELDQITQTTPELNVLESCVRNSTIVYDKNLNDDIDTTKETYPKQMRYIPYIKNGEIQIYAPKVVNGKVIYSENDWKNCHFQYAGHETTHKPGTNWFIPKGYVYNLKIRNYTKNLKIQNNVYDSYTHEYLGDFLRFHRDYKNINLMPLYNCFSNRTCPELDLEIKITDSYTAEFKTLDPKYTEPRYKIYMVPVKLFKDYTIAIDSDEAIEMCCGLFGQYPYDKDLNKTIAGLTYTCYNSMQFKSPKLFTAVNNLSSLTKLLDTSELAQHEDDLKLFIKLPIDNNSSITILEGDYTMYNDKIGKNNNRSVINFDSDLQKLSDKLITPLQLLMANTHESYPFADRLIEYLVGNAITSDDSIGDNVKRGKVIAEKNIAANDLSKVIPIISDEIWVPALKYLYYNFMSTKYGATEANHDILGFIDKDVETYYSCITRDHYYQNGVRINLETPEIDTIASVDIYDETWED